MIDGRFPIVVADFPWPYKDKWTGASGNSGAAAKYNVMSWEALEKFPIHDILAENAILFLWVTVPHKFKAVDLVNTWGGLEYKTTIFWRKLSHGMGRWARGCVEEIWILKKGNVQALKYQGKNVLEELEDNGLRFPVGWIKTRIARHSRKPEKALQMIEEMIAPFPVLNRKVDLFATQERPGWETVGHELGSDVFEFAEHCKFPLSYSKTICSICGWGLKETQDEGCLVGDCCQRPFPKPGEEFDTYRARLEGQLKPFKQEAA